jgi:predicted MFS family arabinose efflux permease
MPTATGKQQLLQVVARSTAGARPPLFTQSMLALDSLNVWIADVQSLGGLAAVFLSSKEHGGLGWSLSTTGYVMTAMGLSNVLASPAAGALMDSASHKREIMASLLVLTGCTYVTLWKMTENPVMVVGSLIVQANRQCRVWAWSQLPQRGPGGPGLLHSALRTQRDLQAPGRCDLSGAAHSTHPSLRL